MKLVAIGHRHTFKQYFINNQFYITGRSLSAFELLLSPITVQLKLKDEDCFKSGKAGACNEYCIGAQEAGLGMKEEVAALLRTLSESACDVV